MTEINKQGMRLRQMENPRGKGNNWLVKMLSAMFCCAAFIFCCGSMIGFGGSNVLPVMLLVSVYLCVMYGLMLRFGKAHWFYVAVLALMLLAVLLFREEILEGFRLFWSKMQDAKLLGTGLLWPEWQSKLPKEESAFCLTLFAVLAVSALSLLICFLTNCCPMLMAILLPASVLAVMVIFAVKLNSLWAILILFASVFTLLCGGWGSKNVFSCITTSWLMAAVLGAVLLAFASSPQIEQWAEQLGNKVQHSIHYRQYETEHTTLPEGDFRNYQQVKKPAEAGLIVTMEHPEEMYFRGFTGSVFEDNQWKSLENELLLKNENLLYWLNLNAFNPNAQFDSAASGTELVRGNMTVQNKGACSLYKYVPFSLCAGEYLLAENLNTAGVISDGERVYSYWALAGGDQAIAAVLQHLQQSNDEAVLQYRKAESSYRNFVRNFYLQIPDDAKSILEESWRETAKAYGDVDSLSVEQAQECVLSFLSYCFPESGTVEDLELPLSVAEGTSYQYATVAALTLRYFGIPARYVEGYVITESMAASAVPGQTIAVDGSCGRAWVEIYQEGIGWIPMDMTPGIGEMIQENPDEPSEKGDGETENEDDPEETEEENPMETDKEVPDPDGGSLVRIIRKIFSTLIKVLLVLLIIIFALLLRRWLVNKQKEKKFGDENTKNAVAWIFADAVNILEKQGFDRENGSLRNLLRPVEDSYGEEYAKELEGMISLNDLALFSSRSMDNQQREEMLSFRLATIENVKTHVKWYKVLWQKWFRTLY